MDEDQLDRTLWDRVRRRERYEGDERRGRQQPNLIAYLPLLLACLAAVAGYVQQAADVKTLRRDVDDAKFAYRNWNASISERVLKLERGE